MKAVYRDNRCVQVGATLADVISPDASEANAGVEDVVGRAAAGWIRTGAGVYRPPTTNEDKKKLGDEIAARCCAAVERMIPHIRYWKENGGDSASRATNTETNWINRLMFGGYFYRQYGTATEYHDYMVKVEAELKLGNDAISRQEVYASAIDSGIWGWYGWHTIATWSNTPATGVIYFTSNTGGWGTLVSLPQGANYDAAVAAFTNSTTLFTLVK